MGIEFDIPFGAENAITREALCLKRGLSDSSMRIEVAEAKLRTPIVSTCKHKGYYRPRADRPEEIQAAKAYQNDLFNTARAMMAQLKILDNFINPSGQLDLFSEV